MSDEKKKRGRKRKNTLYFGPEQEDAVVEFMSLGQMIQHPDYPDDPKQMVWTGTLEEENRRERVYLNHLRDPLNKMIESIIRKYGLWRPGWLEEDLHADTLSFLATKMHKFKPEKNKKAYSYFGTICKHYLLGQLIKDNKKMKTDLSYEDVKGRVEEKDDYIYHLEDKDKTKMDAFIIEISASIKAEMEHSKLNDNELMVGGALIEVLDNWENIFEQVGSGNKYNKNLILQYIRDISGLTTKDIRVSMKRFKKLYVLIKNSKIDQGLI